MSSIRKASIVALALVMTLLLGAADCLAATLSDRQVANQTDSILGQAKGVSFSSQVVHKAGKKTLVVGMRPSGFMANGADELGKLAAAGILLACVHADQGYGFHQVEMDVEGVGSVSMTLDDFRYIMANKVDMSELSRRVTFIPR